MSDLIRRQEAIDELWKSEMAFRPSQIDEVMRILCKVPTIDAVPVVRCKDCKHHHDSFGEEYCYRSYTPMPVSAEWFCPKGERKNDE